MKLEELQENLQDKLIEYCQLKNNWSLADDLCEIVIIEISAFHKANYKKPTHKNKRETCYGCGSKVTIAPADIPGSMMPLQVLCDDCARANIGAIGEPIHEPRQSHAIN